MSAYPSLPLFTDAFLADTEHLTAEKTGAYLLLLMQAWRAPECRLPNNDERLARWARVSDKTWRNIKSDVMEFWTLTDGFWTQKRLTREREIVEQRAEVARQNGRSGGRPRKPGGFPPGSPNGTQPRTGSKAPNPSPNPNSDAATAAPPARGAPRSDLRQRFEEIEAACRSALGDLAPVDVVIGPIVSLVDQGHDLSRAILPALIDAARGSREPIRTWRLLATKVGERIARDAQTSTIIPFAGGRERHGTSVVEAGRRLVERAREAERLQSELRGGGSDQDVRLLAQDRCG